MTLAGYRRLVKRRVSILVLLAVSICVSCGLDLITGPSDLTALDAIRGLLWPESLSTPVSVIIWQVRLPYALMALLVGAALSLAGAEMQTTLNNPLASPFTLGMSSAAIFGAKRAAKPWCFSGSRCSSRSTRSCRSRSS